MTQPQFKTLATPRVDAEFDLVAASIEVLTLEGLDQAKIDFYKSSPEIQQATGLTLPQQMFILSRFWEFQLMQLMLANKQDTQPHRFVLTTCQDPQTWLKLLKEHVVPLCKGSMIPSSPNQMGLFRYAPSA